jgi:hypothetical protein
MKAGSSVFAADDANSDVSMRCPACHKQGIFHSIFGVADAGWNMVEPKGRHTEATSELEQLANSLAMPVAYSAGVRRCPNSECREIVFVVLRSGKLHESFPAEPLDIDLSGVPDSVSNSLDEAVRCHAAGCYRAAALMVRRSLEELCADKGAAGRDLRSRINALRTTIVISSELLDAAHELRILGNDAAHLEARAYDDISDTEVEVAIELAKELIKAIYQYSALVKKMRALKRPSAGQ